MNKTYTYGAATFTARDQNAAKVLFCLHANLCYGRPAHERFVEAVKELIEDGLVVGPRNFSIAI